MLFEMTSQELEQLTATAREDITKLLKQYARAGYRAAHGQRDEDFEELWAQIFDAGRAEVKEPAE